MKRRTTCGKSDISRLAVSAILLCLGMYFPLHVSSFVPPNFQGSISRVPSYSVAMIAMPLVDGAAGNWGRDEDGKNKHRVRKKYKRKREKPQTEKESDQVRSMRELKYKEIKNKASGSSPSIFSFEALFPQPIFDEATVHRDLYEVLERDGKIGRLTATQKKPTPKPDVIRELTKLRSSDIGGSSMMRVWREPKSARHVLSYDPTSSQTSSNVNAALSAQSSSPAEPTLKLGVVQQTDQLADSSRDGSANDTGAVVNAVTATNALPAVDRTLTRMVEDRVFGYRRSKGGAFEYDTSLMGDGAVKFREGVRLGNPLQVNADRITYHARKELARGRVEEAQELYEKAIEIDPRDGRAYLGLSKVAERRRDFKLARECLRVGIQNSVSIMSDEAHDRGGNPFLLQALGCLEEKMGLLSEAESLYISAVKSRPSHAAAWVSLAQLRVGKLRQSAAAGRVCYQTAERELKLAGRPPSSFVYTAWASMEYKKAGDVRRARELFESALKVDKKCSAALLQLGTMEADKENWKDAEKCFERVLNFDQRNSRVLQAYAIMETKRPDGDSRKAIGLFERALKANPRDAGVLQAYALFVAKLGDIDSARDL
jgi:tetratricopeptide (TPR) repeat protein